VSELIHFTATWAEEICGPHRAEVVAAAEALGTRVREVDVDADPALVRAYRVLNVPAVSAVDDISNAPVVGAHSASGLADQLRGRVAR
jgi:hypothetical protein